MWIVALSMWQVGVRDCIEVGAPGKGFPFFQVWFDPSAPAPTERSGRTIGNADGSARF